MTVLLALAISSIGSAIKAAVARPCRSISPLTLTGCAVLLLAFSALPAQVEKPGSPGGPDAAELTAPASDTVLPGELVIAEGLAFVDGLTDQPGESPEIEAQFIIGDANADFSTWTYIVPAAYDSERGLSDVYTAQLPQLRSDGPLGGNYGVLFRFRVSSGPWVTGDLNNSLDGVNQANYGQLFVTDQILDVSSSCVAPVEPIRIVAEAPKSAQDLDSIEVFLKVAENPLGKLPNNFGLYLSYDSTVFESVGPGSAASLITVSGEAPEVITVDGMSVIYLKFDATSLVESEPTLASWEFTVFDSEGSIQNTKFGIERKFVSSAGELYPFEFIPAQLITNQDIVIQALPPIGSALPGELVDVDFRAMGNDGFLQPNQALIRFDYDSEKVSITGINPLEGSIISNDSGDLGSGPILSREITLDLSGSSSPDNANPGLFTAQFQANPGSRGSAEIAIDEAISTISEDASELSYGVITRPVEISSPVYDPSPFGDGDGLAEPGEIVSLPLSLANIKFDESAENVSAFISVLTGTSEITGPVNFDFDFVKPGQLKESLTDITLLIPETEPCVDIVLDVSVSSSLGSCNYTITIPAPALCDFTPPTEAIIQGKVELIDNADGLAFGPSDQVVLTVDVIKNPTELIPNNGSFRVRFNSDALTFSGVAGADLGPSATGPVEGTAPNQFIDFATLGSTNIDPTPTVATIVFDVNDPSAFPSDLILELDPDASSPLVDTSSGTTVIPSLFDPRAGFDLGPEANFGDADEDNTVNLVDSVELSELVLGLREAAGLNLLNGDVNCDGVISPVDSMVLNAFAIGDLAVLPHPPALPVEETVEVTPFTAFTSLLTGDLVEVNYEVSSSTLPTPAEGFFLNTVYSTELSFLSASAGAVGNPLVSLEFGFAPFPERNAAAYGSVSNTITFPRLVSYTFELLTEGSSPVAGGRDALIYFDDLKKVAVGSVDSAAILPALGDVDGNGVVNAADAAELLQALLGLPNNLVYPQAGDLDDNSSVETYDAAVIAGVVDGSILIEGPALQPALTGGSIELEVVAEGFDGTPNDDFEIVVRAVNNTTSLVPWHFVFGLEYSNSLILNSVTGGDLPNLLGGSVNPVTASIDQVFVSNLDTPGSVTAINPELARFQFQLSASPTFPISIALGGEQIITTDGFSYNLEIPASIDNQVSLLFPPGITGDINQDGLVDGGDASDFMNFLAGNIGGSGLNLGLSDAVADTGRGSAFEATADFAAMNAVGNGLLLAGDLPLPPPSPASAPADIRSFLVAGNGRPDSNLVIEFVVTSNPDGDPIDSFAFQLNYPTDLTLERVSGNTVIGPYDGSGVPVFGVFDNPAATPRLFRAVFSVPALVSYPINIELAEGLYTPMAGQAVSKIYETVSIDNDLTRNIEPLLDPCPTGTPFITTPTPDPIDPTPTATPTADPGIPSVYNVVLENDGTLTADYVLPPNDGLRYFIGYWIRRTNEPGSNFEYQGIFEFFERQNGPVVESSSSINVDVLPDSTYEIAAQMFLDGSGFIGQNVVNDFSNLPTMDLPTIEFIEYDSDAKVVRATFDTIPTVESYIGFWYRPIFPPEGGEVEPFIPTESWVYTGITPIPLQTGSIEIPFDAENVPGSPSTDFEISCAIFAPGQGFIFPPALEYTVEGIDIFPNISAMFLEPEQGRIRTVFNPSGNADCRVGFWYREVDRDSCLPICDWKFIGFQDYIPNSREITHSLFVNDPTNPDVIYEGAARLYLRDDEIPFREFFRDFFVRSIECIPVGM